MQIKIGGKAWGWGRWWAEREHAVHLPEEKETLVTH